VTLRMNEPRSNSTERSSVPASVSLPKRDYFLLPLVSLATVLLVFEVSEILTREIWAEHKAGSCTVVDPIAGDNFKPNCTIRTKNALESLPLVICGAAFQHVKPRPD
jgi:hypothetical protein